MEHRLYSTGKIAKYIVCDIDGTLADLSHRKHFIEEPHKDWDSFYEACDLDSPIIKICTLVNIIYSNGFGVIYVSGRRESTRSKTLAWLNRYGLPNGELFMRPDGDCRPDNEIKLEILKNNLNKSRIWLVIDDRDKVVKMWRANGLTCLQVANGNF